MVMVYQTVGNTIAQWEESSPLTWSIQETIGKGDDRRTNSFKLDISPLVDGYEMPFLLALKDVLMARTHRVALQTVRNDAMQLKGLLKQCNQDGIMTGKVAQIDSAFLLGLNTCSDRIHKDGLVSLKRLFEANRANTKLFDGTLYPEDFPLKKSKRGRQGTG